MNRLNALYCFITRGCNLRCRHCYTGARHRTDEMHPQAIDTGLFRDVVRQAKQLGVSYVKLSGGEPLLHPRIGEILETAGRERIGLVLSTNGVLCTPSLVRELSRIRLRGVSVSLDGADAETHEWVRGETGCFAKAVQGIRTLAEAGLSPSIGMVVLRRNIRQVKAVVDLAESLGASSVTFNLAQPTGRGAALFDDGEFPEIRDLIELDGLVRELSRRTPLALSYTLPPAFKPLGGFLGAAGRGYGACGILSVLGVLSDGSLGLCGAAEGMPELIFGHAGRDDLEAVWRHAPLLEEIREGLPDRFKGICGECLMRSLCQGRCIAQNYYRRRDVWAPHWFCEEADRQGLFPEARRQRRHGEGGKGGRFQARAAAVMS
ncbi:MAG: SynChlorMet cassette radical SAM/SPASM protein ScmF [Syntrophales bacterium]|nr:SynChlorMet cassette radical SAM/SPASM protein ScmF [Syntrophales bacterium]MCU0582926.1 SynChlorMet cassette radical SAM/SPASM protein ScmF [Syntrophales bacterium]